MFDKLVYGLCIITPALLAGCDDPFTRAFTPPTNRTVPVSAFYQPPVAAPVVVETPVTPVAEVEDVPVYTPPTVYVEPIRDPNICIEEWRKPCPHD